jgi:hypothetical protein
LEGKKLNLHDSVVSKKKKRRSEKKATKLEDEIRIHNLSEVQSLHADEREENVKNDKCKT